MSNINFDNPWLLLVAVPLIVLFTVPFLIAVRKDNRNAHNIASQIMHVVLAIIIGFAAAGTNFTTVLTQTQVYIVADVSYSANKNLDTIDNIIKSQIELPKNSKVGVITFGKNYELLCDLTDQSKLTSVKASIENGTIDDSETNIAEALLYAGTLFGEEVIKRVVLITDGKQTDDVDTSAMRRAVDTLEAQGVKVDAYFLDDNLSSDTPEVQISSAEFTPSAFLNHDEKVTVTIQSNIQTDVMVYLYKNGNMLDESTRTATLDVGNNRVEMDLDTTESGWQNYEIRIRAVPEENDASEYNNSYSFTQNVAADKKVLIVTGDWADAQLLVEQYAVGASVDIYENAVGIPANERRAFQAKVASTYENAAAYCFGNGVNIVDVPFNLEDICQYDEIVLSNVDIRTINNTTRFMQNLEVAVATLGKSLITLGNTYIADTLVEPNSDLDKLSAMLPVRYGPSLNGDRQYYTIIMDISSSMQGVQLQAAKDVAKKLLTTLQDEEGKADMISLIALYGNSWEFWSAQPYKGDKENIDKMYELIDSLEVRQGTNLSQALSTAYKNLAGSSNEYTNKQIMLITDGKNSTSDYTPSENYVKMLRDIGVITSIFDVGRLGDNPATALNPTGSPDTSNPAYQFLKRLCDIGVDDDGNQLSQYYYCYMISAEVVPDIVFGDMFSQIKETVVTDRDTKVIVNKYSDDVLAGMPNTSDDMPHVTGYYVGTSRGSAISVLDLDYGKKPDGSSDIKALYAYWTYGEGKVASFSGSPTGEGMRYWTGTATSGGNKTLVEKFLANVLDTNVPSVKADYPYTFSVLRNGNATHVTVTPPRDNESAAVLKLSATIKVWLLNSSDSLNTDDIEPIKEAEMTFNKDHFYYDFTSTEEGKYKIEVVYSNSLLQKEYSSVSAFNVAYENEYNSFTGYEASPLYRAINGRGQVIDDGGKLELKNEDYEVGTYTNDYTIPLLVIAVVLFVVDIIVRKLKWEDIVSFFGGFKKTQTTTGGKKS